MSRVSWCVVLLLSPLVAAGVFDFTEFDDPLSTWSQFGGTAGGLLRAGSECRAGGRDDDRRGVCRSSLDCRLSGGRSTGRGSCSVAQQCCLFEGRCDSVTSKKVSYFRSPRDVPTGACTYTVRPSSAAVCQVRLDLEDFQLAPPTMSGGTTPRSLCADDTLEVTTANGFRPPVLCGYNTGQHMYVPMNVSGNELSVKLLVNLRQRDSAAVGLLPANPSWRIRVTQLECATGRATPTKLKPYSAQTDDTWKLAPANCLQYFTERSGNFSSFGYGGAQQGRYIGGHNYAVCFARSATDCGLSISSPGGQFRLAEPDPTTGCQSDYVFIPETTATPDDPSVLNYKYCGTMIPDMTTVATASPGSPGPLYVHVVTNGELDADGSGFRLFWTLRRNNDCS